MQTCTAKDELWHSYSRPISFNELIVDTHQTAIQSNELGVDIFETYDKVYGPIQEMNGMDIGELIIQFHDDGDLSSINIWKYQTGYKYVDVSLATDDPLNCAYITVFEIIGYNILSLSRP